MLATTLCLMQFSRCIRDKREGSNFIVHQIQRSFEWQFNYCVSLTRLIDLSVRQDGTLCQSDLLLPEVGQILFLKASKCNG